MEFSIGRHTITWNSPEFTRGDIVVMGLGLIVYWFIEWYYFDFNAPWWVLCVYMVAFFIVSMVHGTWKDYRKARSKRQSIDPVNE